jgi:hypothetical protein
MNLTPNDHGGLFHPVAFTKEEAIERGIRRYRGAPCRNGHNGTRYVRSGSCVECQARKARVREYGVNTSRMIDIDRKLRELEETDDYYDFA